MSMFMKSKAKWKLLKEDRARIRRWVGEPCTIYVGPREEGNFGVFVLVEKDDLWIDVPEYIHRVSHSELEYVGRKWSTLKV